MLTAQSNQQPATRSAFVAQLVDRPPSPREGLLDQIFGLITVVTQPVGVAIEIARQRIDERREAGFFLPHLPSGRLSRVGGSQCVRLFASRDRALGNGSGEQSRGKGWYLSFG